MKNDEINRGYGRTLQGVVVSNKMEKTIVVQVERRVPHPRYNKFIKRRSKYYAHDEDNQSQIGDTVLVVESSPYSKTKRWRLRSILERKEA
jgi:small subunit ribosomal protein S17